MCKGETQNSKFKRELVLTLVCIIIYFTGMISANILSKVINIPDMSNAIFEIIFALGIITFFKKKNLLSYYGINDLKKLNYKNLLYFIPMILIASVNLWFGFCIKYPVRQTIFILIAMLGVGFAEEILFRSLLMRALMNKNEKAAIIISSVIFGAAHITNLFGGADLFLTTLQIFYAIAFGFMCAIFFYKTGNIIPCIICHSLTNMLDTFMPEDLSIFISCMGCVAFIAFSTFYGLYLLMTKKALLKEAIKF